MVTPVVTSAVALVLPGQPPKPLGAVTGASLDEVTAKVLARFPLAPVGCLTLDGVPIIGVPLVAPEPTKQPGFRDPGTRAKAAQRLRDPEVQARKVAKRLATEAARREREAQLTPAQRETLRKRRKARYDDRWRRYWQDKATQKAARKAQEGTP
jgi:hypothetical protein